MQQALRWLYHTFPSEFLKLLCKKLCFFRAISPCVLSSPRIGNASFEKFMVSDFTRKVPAVMLTHNADGSGLVSCSAFEPRCCCLIGDQYYYKRETNFGSYLHFLFFLWAVRKGRTTRFKCLVSNIGPTTQVLSSISRIYNVFYLKKLCRSKWGSQIIKSRFDSF